MTIMTILTAGTNLLVDAAISLEPNLHPSSAGPVGHLGVAPASARDDVHVVILCGASNKPAIQVGKSCQQIYRVFQGFGMSSNVNNFIHIQFSKTL